MELGSILGISALLLSILVGAWLKVLTGRAFKSIDDSILLFRQSLSTIKLSLTNVEKDVIRIDGEIKRIKDNVEQIRGSSARESQIMINQLESIHNKIQYVDTKLDRLRESRK